MTLVNSSDKELTIVIAAWNETKSLSKLLESFSQQIDPLRTEVIIASNYDIGHLEDQGVFGLSFRFLRLPAETTVPELRTAGILESRGQIIALTEDLCTVDSTWCRSLLEAHARSHSVVGGSIDNVSTERLIDWAVYFFEYGRYMRPNRDGPVEALSGLNSSYDRSLLEKFRWLYQNGFFEWTFNSVLLENGVELHLESGAAVYHSKHYAAMRVTKDFYHHGRSLAGTRIETISATKRAFYVATSIVLPFLLLGRVIKTIALKRKQIPMLIFSLPYTILIVSSWSFGELVGYLSGQGRSPRNWR